MGFHFLIYSLYRVYSDDMQNQFVEFSMGKTVFYVPRTQKRKHIVWIYVDVLTQGLCKSYSNEFAKNFTKPLLFGLNKLTIIWREI